jgi:hypothetical protein
MILLQACGDKSAVPASAAGPQRIRGTVQSLAGQDLVVVTSSGPVHVQLSPSVAIAGVVASDRAHISEGSFLGIGSVAEPDGSQRAIEVTVFPEAMRGTGEGSYPWGRPDVAGGGNMTNGTVGASKMTNGTVSASTMTNGTVASSRMTNGTVASRTGSAALTLTYKSGTSQGSQTIAIPEGVPIVALEIGQRTDLRPGVHVLVLANRDAGGALTADRVLAGKNGLVPPM